MENFHMMVEMNKAKQIELEHEARHIYNSNKFGKVDSELVVVKWIKRFLNQFGNTLINIGSYLQKMANPAQESIQCQDC